ncbi:MAG: HEAT repeat domain-containing protein, partial [Gemmataceae bacterium]|nr:HEAT repeat domain-containing protein [Gemmataceae bacterium]
VVLLGAREADVRAAAAEALGRVGPDATPALPKLKAALKDPSVAAAARRAIEKIGGGDGGPG